MFTVQISKLLSLQLLGREQIMSLVYSQYVTDDPNAPHVSGQAYRLIVNHFWCHKLWSTVHHLQRCVAICYKVQNLILKYTQE